MYQHPPKADGTPGDLVPTQANTEWAQAPVMPKLRDLVYRCLNDERSERPDLDKTIKLCEDMEQHLDETQQRNESDGAIRQFVKRFLFDADDGSVVGTKRRRTRTPEIDPDVVDGTRPWRALKRRCVEWDSSRRMSSMY